MLWHHLLAQTLCHPREMGVREGTRGSRFQIHKPLFSSSASWGSRQGFQKLQTLQLTGGSLTVSHLRSHFYGSEAHFLVRWLDSNTDSMDINWSKLQEAVEHREALLTESLSFLANFLKEHCDNCSQQAESDSRIDFGNLYWSYCWWSLKHLAVTDFTYVKEN